MFRSRPIWFVVWCVLIVVGLGAVVLFIWWLRAMGTTLTVTSERTILRKGILSKDESEVLHRNVRNVVLKQGVFQRMMGTGYIAISSSGQSDMEIEAHGMPRPDKIKALIYKHRG